MKNCIFALVVLLLAGCSTPTAKPTKHNLNRLSLGMTKQQVIETIGEPSNTRATGETEYLVYLVGPSTFTKLAALQYYGVLGYGDYDFYVRLVGGRVDAFGKVGDFDSTNPQRYDVNINTTGTTPQSPRAQSSAYNQALQDGFRAFTNNDYEVAVVFFQKATDLDRSSAQAWANLGIAQAGSHNFLDALYSLKRALELNPTDQIRLMTLGGLAGIYGMLDEGAKYAETLEMVRRLDPALADKVVETVREEKAKK